MRETDVEQAWVRFRARLADRLAEMVDDDVLVVEVEVGPDVDELVGAAPYVQVLGWRDGRGGDHLRLETVSNDYLDERWALDDEQEAALVAMGYVAPGPDRADNFHLDARPREADRVAHLAVRALREVHGCPHPAFLLTDDLPAEPSAVGAPPEVAPEPSLVRPLDRDHLLALTVDALRVMLGEGLEADEDGDVPVECGGVTAYVQVLEDRPGLQLFAPLLLDLPEPDSPQALLALNHLHRRHPGLQLRLVGDVVVARARHVAWPFVPEQVRAVVAEFCQDLDEIALCLVEELGGRRPADPAAVGAAPGPDSHPSMVGLLEMLHEGDVDDDSVAALFDHDRQELVRQLVWVRTGRQGCDGHDQERVLGHLRRALRFASDSEARARRRPVPPRRVPPRRPEVQPSLLPDDELGEGSLDLGWSA